MPNQTPKRKSPRQEARQGDSHPRRTPYQAIGLISGVITGVIVGAVIARVEARVNAPPVPAPAETDWPGFDAGKEEYRHVTASGRFVKTPYGVPP